VSRPRHLLSRINRSGSGHTDGVPIENLILHDLLVDPRVEGRNQG
jgi:hypothetical protein